MNCKDDMGCVQEKMAALRAKGEPAGIKFSIEGRLGNTLDSHRLIYYALR
jgi:hypothetical protein